MTLSTPWGTSDYVETVEAGVFNVGTPRHGGFMVAAYVARERLSPAAVKRGRRWGDYFCYEEDSDWKIVAYELESVRSHLCRDTPSYRQEQFLEELHRSLSAWHADYLLERGIEPDSNGYAAYQARQLQEQMRERRDPDLVVSAYGSWLTGDNNLIEVITADDERYLVEAASYDSNRVPNLLSICRVVHKVRRLYARCEAASPLSGYPPVDIVSLYTDSVCAERCMVLRADADPALLRRDNQIALGGDLVFLTWLS